MDLGKAFNTLASGKIISIKSKEHQECAHFLLNEDNQRDLEDVLNKIGYILIAENGYFYLSKNERMSAEERMTFISKHRDLILAISIIRELFQRIDRGNSITYTETVFEFETHRKQNTNIEEKLKSLTWSKASEDPKSMLEQLFKNLEKHLIIEKVDKSNENNYIVLDAIDYYINIVEKVER